MGFWLKIRVGVQEVNQCTYNLLVKFQCVHVTVGASKSSRCEIF